jgi:DNA-binding response OmpR family regulator
MEPDNQPKQILLIDDDTVIREMYATALVKAGLDIVMAENGTQGIELALKHKPAVILLDIEMPDMDGHHVAEKLRLDSWGKTAKIIFLTNRSEPAHVAHAVTLKSEDYIVKANVPVKEVINRVRLAMHT